MSETSALPPLQLPCWIAGQPVRTGNTLDVCYPWDGSLTGSVAVAGPADLEAAIQAALDPANCPLTRYERHTILRRAASLLAERRGEFAALITRETGLAIHETNHETARTSEVLEFAAMEVLRDDGQVFSCWCRSPARSRSASKSAPPSATKSSASSWAATRRSS